MVQNEGCTEDAMKVLLLSDRLLSSAIILSSQLKQSGVNVLGVAQNKEELHELMEVEEVEYVIIVGYLCDVKLYEELRDIRKSNQRITTVQWAMLDSLISTYCCEYSIPLKFERTLPVENFIDFLEKHKNDYITRVKRACQECSAINAEKNTHSREFTRKLMNGAWFRKKVKEFLFS